MASRNKKKNGHQVGVFAVTKDDKIVLVSTRSGEYWIFPKGNTCEFHSDRVMAREEAWEEAGILGSLKQGYESFKTPLSKAKRLHLYPMKVERMYKRFPESDERERILVTYEEAEELLEKDLLSILRKMRKRDYI